jgi:uncharacterized iron-regulated membrane protein
MNFRKLHRKIAPILFIPLFLTALTGVIYRVGKAWFGLPGDAAEIMMVIHQGEFLGDLLTPVYVLLMGLGLVGLVVTGVTMIRRRKTGSTKAPKKDMRWVHRLLAPIAFLPLTVSAITGIGYSLGERWFGLEDDQIDFLMSLHQGSYLGGTLRAVYVFFVGAGLVALLVTGIQMTGIFRKRRPPAVKES